MCGIVGYLTRRPIDQELLGKMCGSLRHRGPDDEGFFRDGPVALGMRRLSIIDVASGHQPIANEDGSVVVVFNGEIYNFRELRARLERAGHRFSTSSDTECIVHLYEEKGDDCVTDLRGMFAFALWDRRQQRLLLARDRVGKKPLHYRILPDGIAFASELKAIVQDPSFSREIDPVGLDHFLAFQYVPAPFSIFAGVQKLPPGHVLTVRAGDTTPAVRRYWDLPYEPKLACSEQEAVELVRHELREATKIRLISERPLGAFLSGGVDSSLIVAFMAELASAPVKTFSIGFDEAEWDERRYARLVAERFGTEHHEAVVRPDAQAILPLLAWHYDEPFADSSAVPSWYLAEMTRSHVAVALNGDGGDESFGGYDRYVAALAGSRIRGGGAVRRAAGAAARVLPPARARTNYAKGRRLLEMLAADRSARYRRLVSCFDDEDRLSLYAPAWRERLEGSRPFALLHPDASVCGAVDPLDQLLSTDVHTYLPGDLLVKMDIATMAHSLEARSPLLDHHVMELAARLPSRMKIRGLDRKRVLKAVARGVLPDEVVDRKKQGFGVPIGEWLRHDLREMAVDLLTDGRLRDRGYFDQARVDKLLGEHLAGRNHATRLWALLQLEQWHRIFVDDRATAAPPPATGAA